MDSGQLFVVANDLLLVLLAFAVLGLDLFLPCERKRLAGYFALAGLLIMFVLQIFVFGKPGTAFGGIYVQDQIAIWFKRLFYISGILTVLLSLDVVHNRAKHLRASNIFQGEYFGLLLFVLAGMNFLVSANELVFLYVALELCTIPLYILVAYHRGDAKCAEAGLKYVIIGALSSGFLLYGFSLIYGLTGTTHIGELAQSLTWSPLMIAATAMMLAGLGFKITMVPFHVWAADVYEGAPTPVTAFLSVGSKAAGLAVMLKIFYVALGQTVEHWSLVIAILATATMTFGNAVAIVQTNMKRMLAYSSIAQAGYILVAFIGVSQLGLASIVYYILIYIVTNLAAFAVVIVYYNHTGKENIEDYAGMSQSNPGLALILMLAMFSLGGIPPLAGFVGKFYLFSAAAEYGYYWLIFVGALNSTASLYYYLRVVRAAYILPAKEDAPQKFKISPALMTALLMTTAGMLVFGLLPQFFDSMMKAAALWF